MILSGGTTIFRGFTERVVKEVGDLGQILKVIENPNRRYASWTGAAILASLSSYESKWITKAEYMEVGS